MIETKVLFPPRNAWNNIDLAKHHLPKKLDPTEMWDPVFWLEREMQDTKNRSGEVISPSTNFNKSGKQGSGGRKYESV